MTIENHDHDLTDAEEEAAFKAAVSDVEGDVKGEQSNGVDSDSTLTDESDSDPLGQMDHAATITQDDGEMGELEQLRADNARLEHSLKSEKGRSKAAQQRWEDTRNRLEQVKSGIANDPQAFLSDNFRENFPELAEEIEVGMAKNAQQANQTMLSALDPMENLVKGELEDYQRREVAEAEQAVEQAFPDARKILQDPHFDQWLQSQPVGVQGLYHSSDPADAIYLLNQYSSTPNPSQRVANRRANQQRALNTQGGRSMPRDSDGLDDEDALWASISKEVRQKHGYR
ncbi:hypothetical protein AB6D40_022865 [Vibrio cyclitrophicus]